MNILYVAPLPPPLNGQSLAAQTFLNSITLENNVTIIDLVKDDHHDGFSGFKRMFQILACLKKIYKHRNYQDIIYLHISESIAGNFRDLAIYFILRNSIGKFYIHLHGGSIENLVFTRSAILKMINFFFYKRIKGMILLGASHRAIFTPPLPLKKVHTVPNFSENDFYCSSRAIFEKYNSIVDFKILYLSNLIPGKGYEFLVEAALSLPPGLKDIVSFSFAGGFQSNEDKDVFLKKINNQSHIKYLGFVGKQEKIEILKQAHAICLPSYILEGQGICLLEGYASGCIAITTGKGGISDIFQDDLNGFKIIEKSPESIVNAIVKLIDQKERLVEIALYNSKVAERDYKSSAFISKLKSIMHL